MHDRVVLTPHLVVVKLKACYVLSKRALLDDSNLIGVMRREGWGPRGDPLPVADLATV